MLIIGHRGAAGLAPENTLEALTAGYEAGADILEFDIRLTKDNVMVLVHDFHTLRTHHKASIINRKTYEELLKLPEHLPQITRIEEVLDMYFGKVILNIELKSRSSGEQLARLLKRKYVKKAADWDNILISSFKVGELLRIRRLVKRANLALLHKDNPFLFVAYHRFIKFTAVGFHRLYLNPLALEIAHRAGLFTYVYTIDRPAAIKHLAEQGIGGIVTDFPNKMTAELVREDALH